MTTSERRTYSDAIKKSEARLAPHIHGDTEQWGVYDSSIEKYDSYFSGVIKKQAIVELIADKPAPLVIDLLSGTAAIAGLFSQLKQRDKKGIAVSLRDIRDEPAKHRDEALGIMQLAGDLRRGKSWRQLDAARQNKPADIIMERGVLGVAGLPMHRLFYDYAMNRMWNMLSPEHGNILLQTYDTGGVNLVRWTASLTKVGVPAAVEDLGFSAALWIQKTPDSPAVLPAP